MPSHLSFNPALKNLPVYQPGRATLYRRGIGTMTARPE